MYLHPPSKLKYLQYDKKIRKKFICLFLNSIFYVKFLLEDIIVFCTCVSINEKKKKKILNYFLRVLTCMVLESISLFRNRVCDCWKMQKFEEIIKPRIFFLKSTISVNQNVVDMQLLKTNSILFLFEFLEEIIWMPRVATDGRGLLSVSVSWNLEIVIFSSYDCIDIMLWTLEVFTVRWLTLSCLIFIIHPWI